MVAPAPPPRRGRGLDGASGGPHGDVVTWPTRTVSVDPAVAELAREFLAGHPEIDTPEARAELARTIQGAVEGWISVELRRVEGEEEGGDEG